MERTSARQLLSLLSRLSSGPKPLTWGRWAAHANIRGSSNCHAPAPRELRRKPGRNRSIGCGCQGATPLPGVKVIARNGVRSLVVETDSSGRAILVVPSGSWDVHDELPGTFSPPARQVKLRRGGSAGLIIPIRMFPDGTISLSARECIHSGRPQCGDVRGGLDGEKSEGAVSSGPVQLDPNLIPARFASLEQATEIRKRDAIDGHRAFARVYTGTKKLDLARKEYADMVREQPASARAHYWLGVFLMLTEKNYKQASDELKSAVKLDPSSM